MAEVVTWSKKSSQGSVHGLTVWLNGTIEGQATFALILDGEPYHPITVSGEVQEKVHMDWYADTAQMTYTPNIVKSGSLTIRYRFED